MKRLLLIVPLSGTLALTGCAGTASEFECNATTSDTCMTMEQANEKAKAREESAAKPAAAGLPRLADGNFRTLSQVSYPLPPQPTIPATGAASGSTAAVKPAGMLVSPPVHPVPNASNRNAPLTATPVSQTFRSPATLPGNYPRPLRKGEQTASLWIAPYIDAEDVYHQPTTVLFVVTPSAWGQPRIN